jgi:hypothetical protein
MKYKKLLLSLGLASVGTGAASAQTPPIVASESRLTINFTLEYQIPALTPKDSDGKNIPGVKRTTNQWFVDKSKPAQDTTDVTTYNELGQTSLKTRYGNKEFIEDLRVQGVIPSTVGWYLSSFNNPQSQTYAIYLRNADGVTAPIRLDPTYISLSAAAVPALTQVPPAADPAPVLGAVDRYSYNGNRRALDTPTTSQLRFYTKGTRHISSRHTLTITIASRFPTAPTGLVRLEVQSVINPTAAFPPTWNVKSVKSSGLILAGTRNVLNQVGAQITVPVLIDGSFNGSSGIAYDASAESATPPLPTGVVAP